MCGKQMANMLCDQLAGGEGGVRWNIFLGGGGGLTRRIRELGCGGDFWRECESDNMGKRSVCDKSQEGEQTGAEVLGGGGGSFGKRGGRQNVGKSGWDGTRE